MIEFLFRLDDRCLRLFAEPTYPLSNVARLKERRRCVAAMFPPRGRCCPAVAEALACPKKKLRARDVVVVVVVVVFHQFDGGRGVSYLRAAAVIDDKLQPFCSTLTPLLNRRRFKIVAARDEGPKCS